MGVTRTAYVETYGCSLNTSDAEHIAGQLVAHGYALMQRPEQAQLIILNTCAVKLATEQKMRKRIRQLAELQQRSRSKRRVVVAGCLPELVGKQLAKEFPNVIFVGTKLSKLCNVLSLPQREYGPHLPKIQTSRFLSIMPIARGCLGACTYCCVKFARGKLRSYGPQDLKQMLKKAVVNAKVIYLTAQDTGCYGLDIGYTLPELLELLLDVQGSYRIRIGMMTPHYFIRYERELIKLLREQERLFKFLHLPVQSGSDEVLQRMRRPYSAEDFIDAVKRVRAKIPKLFLATDVIVGFPGETKRDFKKTIELIEAIKPDNVNVSRFGARPGAEASAFPDRVSENEKKARSRQLSELARKLSLERNREFVGMEETTIFYEEGQKGGYVGRTDHYRAVVVKENVLGQFRKVKLAEAKPTYLVGRLV
jgi:MiaB-like tRNA modifying enzyme